VVAWQSNSGQDGDGWGIYAQRFASNGEAIGPEVRVNTLAGGNQSWAQVAALSTGGYVITWQDDGANDGSGYGVYGQRFDAGGSALGGQFLINTTTTSTQYHNNVAAYDGGFAAVWSTGSDIYLQRFTNDGAGGRNPGQHRARRPAPRAASTCPTWPPGATATSSSCGPTEAPTTAATGVYGRLYNAGTGSFGSSFLVNTTTVSYQSLRQ
jgi:hypothetical protein